MFHKLLKNRILLTLVLSSLVVGILLLCTPILQVLDKQIQNNYYVLKNIISPREVSENIVIATIDKETLEQLGRFPFERSVYRDFIENTESAGAGTIAFDIIFSDTTSPEQDDSFA
jgi:adenylate cyclase